MDRNPLPARANEPPNLKEVPQTVRIPQRTKEFYRGSFLGKGRFARCYEFTDIATRAVVAGKVVSKLLLQKPHQKDKMVQEISIHRSLDHRHVVKLNDYFEDDDNVYIILELCERRSLMELHKRRRGVTEPEAKYITYQVADGVAYLHRQKIIHRGLKLGNIFINNEMDIKIGGFSLATTVEMEGERKQTLLGTPNYIAPEVLDKKVHSFPVDVWAIGCILYTLIVGHPPFVAKELKETYDRIKANRYKIPCWMSPEAAELVRILLSPEPTLRPPSSFIYRDPFFGGYMPTRLPTSCLTMAPKYAPDQCPVPRRCGCCPHPLGAAVGSGSMGVSGAVGGGGGRPTIPASRATAASQQQQQMMPPPMVRPLHARSENQRGAEGGASSGDQQQKRAAPDVHLSDLCSQLVSVVGHTAPNLRAFSSEDVAEAPECMPVFSIIKWVDYSDQSGFGYQLSDISVGALFRDSTKMVFYAAGNQVMYVDRDGGEEHFARNAHPQHITNKVNILNNYHYYMENHIAHAGEHMARKDGDELARLPCLRAWIRTRSAIVLQMSNGTLQLNFFQLRPSLFSLSVMSALLVALFSLLAVHCLAQESSTSTITSATETNATCMPFGVCYSNEECGVKVDGTNGTCFGAFIGKCNCNACNNFWFCQSDEACGGLKGACSNTTSLCDCYEGYKLNGYPSFIDALTKLCNQKDCDGSDAEACHGLPCNSGRCVC